MIKQDIKIVLSNDDLYPLDLILNDFKIKYIPVYTKIDELIKLRIQNQLLEEQYNKIYKDYLNECRTILLVMKQKIIDIYLCSVIEKQMYKKGELVDFEAVPIINNLKKELSELDGFKKSSLSKEVIHPISGHTHNIAILCKYLSKYNLSIDYTTLNSNSCVLNQDKIECIKKSVERIQGELINYQSSPKAFTANVTATHIKTKEKV